MLLKIYVYSLHVNYYIIVTLSRRQRNIILIFIRYFGTKPILTTICLYHIIRKDSSHEGM